MTYGIFPRVSVESTVFFYKSLDKEKMCITHVLSSRVLDFRVFKNINKLATIIGTSAQQLLNNYSVKLAVF